MGDSFHVRHQVKPDFIRTIMRELVEKEISREELAERIQVQGYSIGILNEQLTRLRKIGLLKKNGLHLTDAGVLCSQILLRQPSLFYELIHFYHYILWDENKPELNRFSWTYRTVCKNLWEQPSVRMDTRALLDRVIADLIQTFPEENDVSLSTNTINGVLSWLEVLEPKVFVGGVFIRRPFAPPELALLAIQHLYETQKIEYGELLVLDDKALNDIAVLCLVDYDALSEILSEAERRFEWFELQKGWGYFARLQRPPDLTEGI